MKYFVYAISIAGFYLIWHIKDVFNENITGYQMIINLPWISSLSVNLNFGIDVIGLYIIILIIMLTSIAAILSLRWSRNNVKEQLIILYVIQLACISIVASLDALVLIFSVETLFLPFYFAFLINSDKQKKINAMHFLVYEVLGSASILLAFLIMGFAANSFNWFAWINGSEPHLEKVYFIFLTLGLLIKLAIFPMQRWLLSLYSQVSSAISLHLSALMPCMMIFIWMKWGMCVVPVLYHDFAIHLFILSVISVFMSLIQGATSKDLKNVFSYLAMAQIGLILSLLSLFYIINNEDYRILLLDSILFGLISYICATSGLFICLGIIFSRINRKELYVYSGLAHSMPILYVIFSFYLFAVCCFPLSSNFVGYFIALFSLLEYPVVYILFIYLFCINAYAFWITQHIFFGPSKHIIKHLDVKSSEAFCSILLITVIFVLGIIPSTIMRDIHNNNLYLHSYAYKSFADV